MGFCDDHLSTQITERQGTVMYYIIIVMKVMMMKVTVMMQVMMVKVIMMMIPVPEERKKGIES